MESDGCRRHGDSETSTVTSRIVSKLAPLAGRLIKGSEALTAMAPPDGGWRKAKRKEPDASQQTDPSPTASRAAKSRARTAAAGDAATDARHDATTRTATWNGRYEYVPTVRNG